jgi:hypothetical protein
VREKPKPVLTRPEPQYVPQPEPVTYTEPQYVPEPEYIPEPQERISRPAVDRRPPNNRALHIALAVALVFLAVSGIFFGLRMTGVFDPAPKMVEVPDIVGRTLT